MNTSLSDPPFTPRSNASLRYDRIAQLEAVLTVKALNARARWKRYLIGGVLAAAIFAALMIAI
jgi:hypothetical protein